MRDDEFEWHDAKAKLNVRDHGVSFEAGRVAFGDPRAMTRLDLDETDEDRMLLIGLSGDVLLSVSYVERGHRYRIISVRKATKREKEEYNEANAQG
jgi:uncharacterized DUF497 family protein